MPPTKFMTGNIFKGHDSGCIIQSNFNLDRTRDSTCWECLTEAIHTPFMSDRYLSIENAKYIFNNMKSIGDEMEFKEGGINSYSVQQKILA